MFMCITSAWLNFFVIVNALVLNKMFILILQFNVYNIYNCDKNKAIYINSSEQSPTSKPIRSQNKIYS